MVNVLNAFVGTAPMEAGVLNRAPLGTQMPVTALETLDEAFQDNGAVGPDGLTVAPARTTTKHPMLGGGTFVTTQDSYTVEIRVRLMEDDNEAALATVFGDANVEVEEATDAHGVQRTIYYTDEPLPISSFVLNTVSGRKLKRYGIEMGQVLNVSEWQENHTSPTTREVTIEAYKSTKEEYKGAFVVEMRDDGQTTVPTP